MYHITWDDVDEEDVPRYLAGINEEMPDGGFDPTETEIKRHDLPFYADLDLLLVKDGALEKKVLYSEDKVYILNWTNQPIYTANEEAPIVVNEDMAALYSKFFFDHVRGRHGRFLIIEDADEINWSEEPPEDGKKAINDMIAPVEIFETEDDKISMSSYMIFKDSLFKANIHVEKDGMVSLSDEALIVEGMPINEDPAPGDKIAE